MSTFTYTALDREGHKTSGKIPAENRAAAMDQVIGHGLSPVSVEEQPDGKAVIDYASADRPVSTRVPAAAVEAFTRELANLLAGGVCRSAARCTCSAGKPPTPPPRTSGRTSTTTSSAVNRWPMPLPSGRKTFSSVYVAMVRAGETGGFLDIVLEQIADFRTREQDLKGSVKAAMIYPCVLAVLACCVLTFLMTFFIPRFSGIFEDFGGQLPWLTRAIVAISHWAVHWGWAIAIVVVGTVIAVRRALASESGRRFLERAMLRTPLVGKVAARFALVRFCRMLGTLVGAGVPLVASLRVAKEALGNQTLADTVGHAIEEVQHGAALSRSLASDTRALPRFRHRDDRRRRGNRPAR